MGRLEGKVAIVTGGASGIGRASALLFAQEGAEVVVADIDKIKGQESAKLINEAGGVATFAETDVSKLTDIEGMIKLTVATYGKLNILFNNAGQPGPWQVQEVTEQEYHDCLDVNTKGAFFATKYAIPEMRNAGGGSIIFTSSISGLRGSFGSPVYSLAKGGLVTMAMSLALLLGSDNIRVNCICAGTVETPMSRRFFGPKSPEEIERVRGQFIKAIPLGGRIGNPYEIAYAALFLASDEASYITGIALPVDGGLTARF